MSEYHQITLGEWSEMKDRLRRELNDLRTSFVRVGYILRKMEDSKAYEAEGYKSVAEFALKEHGLKPSTTSRWMAINREYSVDGYSEQLDPRYLNMNASQLTEMLTLPDKDRDLVTPDTPREEIRELKRFNADSAASAEDAPANAPAYRKAFEQFLASDPGTAEAVRSCIDAGCADASHLFNVVAPSGSRMYRAGTTFLVFNALTIMVKVFGGASSSASYEEFAEVASEYFSEHERPEEEPPAEEMPEAEEPVSEAEEPEPEPEEPESEPPESESEEPKPERAAAKPEKPEPAEKKKPVERKPSPSVDMNPPEPVAPAQKPEEVIVDEAGNPAPEDPEEAERDRLGMVKVTRDAVYLLKGRLMKEITDMNWPEAREITEELLSKLKYLQENDTEAIMALVERFTAHVGD